MSPKLAGCGTKSAYDRHVRNGEGIDEACRIAHTRAHRAMAGHLDTRSSGPAVMDDTQRQAALAITDRAHDADDARDLLDAIGLLPAHLQTPEVSGG
ncbi:hypothetical protein ACIOG7_10535 [Streptomyces sp. NPDC087894]|uniref:hypothetical protein n=1 Tax=Streptomyces sp. NPDC087894 TaxID=3365816 RepID=UPI0038265C53